MRLPLRLTEQHPALKWIVSVAIALGASMLALGMRAAPAVSDPFVELDDLFYNTFYRLRPFEDRQDGSVLIIAIDDRSLDLVDQNYKFGWPWPREFYGPMIRLA